MKCADYVSTEKQRLEKGIVGSVLTSNKPCRRQHDPGSRSNHRCHSTCQPENGETLMGLHDVLEALRKIVLLQDRVSTLNEEVRNLGNDVDQIRERLARLEGKFELLESLGATTRRRLPSGS